MLIAARNGFAVGGKSILPPGARWVEYLQSHDASRWDGQHILTNVVPQLTDEFSITYQRTSTSPGGYGPYGLTNASINGVYAIFQSEIWFGGARYAGYSAVGNTNKHKVEIRQKIVYVDGNLAYDGTSRTTESASKLSLFYATSAYHGNFRIWDVDIIRNGNPLLSLRPIAIGTTGYMLDLLTGNYLQYGNAGTGDFIIGPDTNAPAI